MSYQIALHSQNVLLPISLEKRETASRLNEAIAKTDAAGAMVVFVAKSGKFSQEFFPLKIGYSQDLPYDGKNWELLCLSAGEGYHSYYLGIPNNCFAWNSEDNDRFKSLSVEIVGSSLLNPSHGYSGGVDIALYDENESSTTPAFINLSERFFPTLLPSNFVEKFAVSTFHFQESEQLLLMAHLQIDPYDKIPVSFEKHWDPKNWIGAVVENLAPELDSELFFTVQGGCFFNRNKKITHWFGGGIGLEEKSFRDEASLKIRDMGIPENGAWVFWLEPQGLKKPLVLQSLLKNGSPAFSIRHSMLWRLLKSASTSEILPNEMPFAGLPIARIVEALRAVAKLLMAHQDFRHQVKALNNGNKVFEAGLKELFQLQGETLSHLESVFDETYGYAPWDLIGNPLREQIVQYLSEPPKTLFSK